ncbi:MAG: hypothetical protein KC656_24315 [Myxococcales bacterium]|nr:hypothetical protein [Myxococcales bacterium]
MWMWLAIASGYEVDPWTPRLVQLNDSAQVASAVFDSMLDDAIDRLPDRCPANDEVLRRKLGRAIAKVTAKRMVLAERRSFAAFGHGRYSGWLERDPLIAKVSTGHEGIFGDVGLGRSAVLRMAGTASTVRFGDVLLGTDKVDHFLATGFDYMRWSHWTEDPDRALKRGTRTEKRFYGRWTSKAFSWADLEANWDGYRFYAGLLDEGSVLQRDPADCVRRVAHFDWTTWVDPAWDEFVNPTVYTDRVTEAIEERVAPDRERICREWRPIDREIPHEGKAPEAAGPFGIEGFCDGS